MIRARLVSVVLTTSCPTLPNLPLEPTWLELAQHFVKTSSIAKSFPKRCRGLPYLKIKKVYWCSVDWFLGVRFLDFFLGFKFPGLLVSTYLGLKVSKITTFPFHVFLKISSPPPLFSNKLLDGSSILFGARLFETFQHVRFQTMRFMQILFVKHDVGFLGFVEVSWGLRR